MCVADVTRQEVNVCGESVNTYFSLIKNKRTKIMQHIKVKTTKNVQYITTIGTIYCVALILPA